MKAKCYQVNAANIKMVERIAAWYLVQFGIPEQRTISQLSNYPNNDVLVQLVIKEGNRVIATGGLYTNTSLAIIFPKYKALSPWIARLYTIKEYRGKGYGAMLLQMLEEYAANAGITQVYLLALTAEKFYKRKGYKQIERLKYKGTDTAVMEKVLPINNAHR